MNRGKPVVLGLTGSIGMGKSTTAAMFARRGVPVHDSDAAVHDLYQPGGKAGAGIRAIIPEAVLADGSVDRNRLGKAVLDQPRLMLTLEALIHPLVHAESRDFLVRNACEPVVVLDIPLLYETGAERRCDAVLVVTADPEVQKNRVLARPGMDVDTFTAILARQWPDAEKRQRADFVIDTGLGFEHAEEQVDMILDRLRNRSHGLPGA